MVSLIEFLKNFYPGLNPNDKSVIALEKNLWDIYFKIIEKIIYSAPIAIEQFIRSTMIRFEVWNIKVIILSMITQTPIDLKTMLIYRIAAQILGREDLLNDLLKARSLEEIQRAFIRSPYEEIVRKGLVQYQTTHEVFYLEQDLDHFYFKSLIDALESIPDTEKSLIEEYIRSNLDFYNLNLLYRTFFNKIPLELIKPFLIPNGFYFKPKEIKNLSESENLDNFVDRLSNIFKGNRFLQNIITEIKLKSLDAWETMQRQFLKAFNVRLAQTYIGDIPFTSMNRIFNLLFNKEFEIREILKQATRIQYTYKNEAPAKSA